MIKRPTTPASIDSDTVMRIVKKIGAVAEVVKVPVNPQSGEALNDCHRIVDKKVATDGGEAVRGWLIWECPDWLIEAICHSVWKSPAGDYVDLTRHEDGETHIAFLPDPRVQWCGEPVPGHRVPLIKNRTLERQLCIANAMDDLQIQAYRENGGPGPIKVERIFDIHRRFTLRNDICFCRSGLKYRDCCKKRLIETAMSRWLYVTSLSGRMCEVERRLKNI